MSQQEPTERTRRRRISLFALFPSVQIPASSAGKSPARFQLAVWFPLVLSLVWSGCRIAEETVQAPVRAVNALVPGTKSSPPDPAALQVGVLRYADEYADRTAAVLDEYARRSGTPEARRQALQWKLAVGSAALNIGTGPNPQANLLDFVALAMVTRMALEEVWTKTTNGLVFEPWLAVSRDLETNVWKLAVGVLTPEQQQELRDVTRRWWEDHPDARAGYFVRPQEFTSLIHQNHEKSDRPGSVFGLMGLDPTAGLDPAVREVARTRLLAERALFMAERMPYLVRWQAELLTEDVLRQEPVARAVGSTERLSRAAESVSQTAAQLPDRITAERKAVLEALEAQEGRLRALSAEVGRTLAAGEKMSTSLNTTLTTFDALMKRFGVGEPSTSPPDTNSPPFNILDYARTADRVAVMAGQVDTLVKDAVGTLDSPALNKRLADLNALSGRAGADAKSVLNHAFLLAAGLVVLALASALVYRRLAPRGTTAPASDRSTGSNP
jgi:hypothetical protein